MKIAIYTKDFSNGSSAKQLDLCKNYILSRYNDKYIDDIFIYKENFIDENSARPEYEQLIYDAESRHYNLLLCYNLRCIFKNVIDFSTTYKLLKENDIDFISVSEQFDTTSSSGRLMASIADAFAELEA